MLIILVVKKCVPPMTESEKDSTRLVKNFAKFIEKKENIFFRSRKRLNLFVMSVKCTKFNYNSLPECSNVPYLACLSRTTHLNTCMTDGQWRSDRYLSHWVHISTHVLLLFPIVPNKEEIQVLMTNCYSFSAIKNITIQAETQSLKSYPLPNELSLWPSF